MTPRNVSQTPVLPVAACSTFIWLKTIQGCRPTSVTTQPASMVITDRTPAIEAIRRNHLVLGRSRRNSQLAPYQRESRNRSVPRPTITSHARWTTLASLTVGWEPAGKALRPLTTVAVPSAGSDRIDARPGMGMPPSTLVPDELRWPNSVSGTSLEVFGTSSIWANLVGSLL